MLSKDTSERLSVLKDNKKNSKKIKEKINKDLSINGFVRLNFKNKEEIFKEKALKLFNKDQLDDLLKLRAQRLNILKKGNENAKKEKNVLIHAAENFMKQNFNILFKYQQIFIVRLKSPLDNKQYKLNFKLSKVR